MISNLTESVEILRQTPATLPHFVGRLFNAWGIADEGTNTWCVYDVVGHFILGEQIAWGDRN